jgi:hypothetical protein
MSTELSIQRHFCIQVNTAFGAFKRKLLKVGSLVASLLPALRTQLLKRDGTSSSRDPTQSLLPCPYVVRLARLPARLKNT